MPEFYRDHILINGNTSSLPYTSIIRGRSNVVPRTNIDRIEQGNRVRDEFSAAISEFSVNAPVDSFVYVVFRSSPGFLLDLEKLDKSDCRVASYRAINEDVGDQVYEATVELNRRAISLFLDKVERYIHENTLKGNPKNQTLIANLDQIRLATLESFWMEPELPFPNPNESVWWEVWLERLDNHSVDDLVNPIYALLQGGDVQIGSGRRLVFPEHVVLLVKGTLEQLGATLLYTNNLSELRKPRETTEFFTYLDKQGQEQWITDLLQRFELNNNDSSVAICLLDTGVNHAHPLLSPIVQQHHLDAIEPHWSRVDTHAHGHGTSMAGLAIFGDLADVFPSNHAIRLYYHFESIKILERAQSNDPELYGAITQEAVGRGELIHPGFKRIVCMAVTTSELVHSGRPSSWSSAIDQICFGLPDEPNETTLFFVSGGNVPLNHRLNYPDINDEMSVEDPAQSFNAITVGSYTIKTQLDFARFPDAVLIAEHGAMSPSNTTSIGWVSEWPRKPDIVMEGGNHGLYNGGLIDPDSLQLLSTAKGGLGRSWFTAFGDTSAATALASKFAADLYCIYPQYWPETIRALMVHSADWTPAMLGGHSLPDLDFAQKLRLISTVGYGVPNFQRARFSASNSLSLIIQRTLKPYKFEDSRVKTDEFHLIALPWPKEALEALYNTEVELKVTLSYFIEPNPGNKQYASAASYRSHGLRFKMIDRLESDEAFAARISKESRDEDYIAEGQERWILGNQIRDKGTVHKDIFRCSAVELASRSKIAVYSVGGWWKNRPKLERYDYSVRYSLVVTISTPDNGVDIYTPVSVQVTIDV